MNIIVAVGSNWEIGQDNKLLMSIPDDMKFFRSMTLDSVVIMGRKTLESFPGQAPLKKRENIVITRDNDYQKDGAIIVHSTDEAVKEAEKYGKPIFVIGGGSIYKQLLPLCDTIYVTKIDKTFPDADTFFPNLDNINGYEITETSESHIFEGTLYRFITYKKNNTR